MADVETQDVVAPDEEAPNAFVTQKKEEEKEEAAEDVIDILEPKDAQKVWKLHLESEEREYVQKPLSYFGKLRFMGLVGDTIDKAMAGDDGLTVNQILGGIGVTAQDFSDVDSFVRAAAKVAQYSPSFMKDCYCIFLNIPGRDWDWAHYALDNISDEDGIEMIEIFIDQNWAAIEDFFTVSARKIQKRVQQQRKQAAEAKSR